MRSILKIDFQPSIRKYTYELFDNHYLLVTVDPNPRYHKVANPWPIAQEELSWNWDDKSRAIKVGRYTHQTSTKQWREEDVITEAYLKLIDSLITE